ncbi:MAG: biotin/lipoyl-containing protein, partial [Pseudomonadota bacterium]
MATDILMPALSPTMEEGTLAKWLVKEGDEVRAGDVIAEIETDKATMEVEAVDEGKISSINVAEGTEGVKVNAVIAVLLEDGESAPAAGTAAAADQAQAEAPSATPEPADEPVPAQAATPVAVEVADDPDIPAGTAMKSTTVREALRDAMAEEMRRSEKVFVMGEEVAEYQGAYKITQGLLQEFG